MGRTIGQELMDYLTDRDLREFYIGCEDYLSRKKIITYSNNEKRRLSNLHGYIRKARVHADLDHVVFNSMAFGSLFFGPAMPIFLAVGEVSRLLNRVLSHAQYKRINRAINIIKELGART